MDIPFNKLFLLVSDIVPEMIYTFIEQNVHPGPHISLKCAVTGSPPPQVIQKEKKTQQPAT